MNKNILTAVALMLGLTATAQNTYDAARFASSDLNGTARYIGMGGALGALGGEITTASNNPAGTAFFRKSEATVTAGGVFTDEKGMLGHDGGRASLDQMGLVFALRQDSRNGKGLQFINFGVNYVKHRNFLGNLDVPVQNLGGIFSQTNQMADMANNAAAFESWGMLADMAAPSYNDDGTVNKDGLIVDYYDDQGNLDHYEGCGAQSALYRRATYGGTAQADLNMSFNVSDRYYFGFSVGVYDIQYNRESFYAETGTDGAFYDVSNWYETTGDGFDLKFGFICRPFESSPFRFGVTVHTPTWYSMEDQNGVTMFYKDKPTFKDHTDPYEYDYRTPWKFGFSLGHTVGTFLALGAEYELSDFSTCHYSSKDWDNEDYFRSINDFTSRNLKVQHTLKLGAEVKPAPEFAIRAGYNYVSSPFKSGCYNVLAFDGPFTETDFTNWKDINRYTLGVGYRFKGGYFDLAYQYQQQKGDFYAFDEVNLQPTSVKNNRSQVVATLGFRF